MNDPTVTAVPTEAVFAGLDWASTDHAVCILDAAGTVLWRHTVSHSRVGLSRLTTRLGELGVSRVGIERPDGPVVEALLNAGLRVAVAPPRQVKNLRSRYTRAGKDDRFDAYVLADAMRTDGHRFTDLTRDSAATIGLRALVRARQDLVEIRVGLVNQLRHILELAFPGAVGLFFDLHSPIARAFLRRFPTAAEAAALDEDSMAAWLAAEGYSGRTPAAVFLDRLRAAPAGLTGAEAAARRHVTLALLAGIDAIEAQAAELTRRIKEALALHPDAPIFTSLPRAGQVWAADIYARARARGMRHPHAVRVLARAWTAVIWRCWQDHTTYDPARHGALNRYLTQGAATAA
jgi:transposase